MGFITRKNKSAVKDFCVDGIMVQLTYKRVKNINLRMASDGMSVKVSAPSWINEQEIEQFVRSKTRWIEKQQEHFQMSLGYAASKQTLDEVAEYRRIVQEKTPPLIKTWEAVLEVESQKLAFCNMKSRWGSCNPQTGRICVNVQLARYPDECLEYIVVHELCHLIEHGHGPRFKALMDQYLPDWKKRRELLRKEP